MTDNPLPWQKSLDKLTPGQVAQAMGGVLAADWYSSPVTQTTRKVSRLETRITPYP